MNLPATALLFTALGGLLVPSPDGLRAASVTLTGDDAVGSTSFNAAGGWGNAAAPSSAHDYRTNDFLLRTPATTTAALTFAGASLTIDATGNVFTGVYDLNDALMFKGTRTGATTITVNNLAIDGAFIRHADNEDSTFRLAGNRLAVGAGGLGFVIQGPVFIDSPVEGSGDIFFLATGTNTARTVTFTSAANTHTGNLRLLDAAQSRFTLASTGALRFVIGASGVNNRVFGAGVATFDGVFKFDLAAASAAYGASWRIVDTDTLSAVFGGAFSVDGFADADGDGDWISNNGFFRFSEATGTLTRIAPRPDTDGDGLPDDWEELHFGDLAQTADADPDGDDQSNLAEFLAGTNPAVPNSAGDTDGDGLPDAWEQTYFGNLSATPAADPDGDGLTNLAEYTAGSVPTNRASTAADTDADGLPDSWELAYFGDLARNAGDDPDADGFGNLQEYAATTSPSDPAARPAGTKVLLVPVDDGDAATSEFGYAGSSAINSVAFVRCSLQTVGDQQFMTWYGRHQYDSAAPFNNTLWIGRRTLGSSRWEVFKHPSFTANTITDGHDVISFGIDGEGFMHLSWGMHGDAFHYAKSTAPVTGSGPIVLGPDTTMTGTESSVTYPQFLRLPDGDLLFLFREVASGNGDTYVNRYDTATHAWRNVHGSATTQSPFIKGTGWSPNYNAYLNMPQLGGPDGDDLILTWCWRFSSGASDNPGSSASGYQTNNRLNYARSPDAGLTWQKFAGTPYTLPITRDGEAGAATTAEVIHDIPENYSLINQASTCLDSAGNPVTATWWAPQTGATNYRRQYMVVFRHANGTWQARAVSSRVTDPVGTRYAENHVRDLGRPTVVLDDADRIIVAYRDNQASNLSGADNSLNNAVSNGITIVHSLPLAEDPDRLLWISFDLTSENLGNYETMIDNELWDTKRQLHFLYQPSAGQGYAAPANTAARISVLEWDAADYFKHSPQPGIETTDGGAGLRIYWRSEPSFTYRLMTSTDLITWTEVSTRAGTGATFEHRHTFVPGEPKRFWRLDRAEGGF